MSNMNNITLEISQPTDIKVFGSSSVDSEKDNSDLFSHLLDQHKAKEQSGKSGTESGKEQHEHTSVKETHSDPIDKQSNKNNGANESNKANDKVTSEDITTEAETSSDTSIKNEGETNSKSNNNGADQRDELLAKSNGKESQNQAQTAEQNSTEAEQLLSFLNASEKVLNANNNSHTQTTTLEQQEKPSITINKSIEELFFEKQQALKTDKTLVAQSVSQQSQDASSEALQQIKSLLNDQEREKASSTKNSSSQSSTENNSITEIIADSDNESETKVKDTKRNDLEASNAQNADKNRISESTNKSIDVVPNDESQAKVVTPKEENVSDVAVKSSETSTTVKNKVQNDTAQLTDELNLSSDEASADKSKLDKLAAEAKQQGSIDPENTSHVKAAKSSESKDQLEGSNTSKIVAENNEQLDQMVAEELEKAPTNAPKAEQIITQSTTNSNAKIENKVAENKSVDTNGRETLTSLSQENLASNSETSEQSKNDTKEAFLSQNRVNDKAEQSIKNKENLQSQAANVQQMTEAEEMAKNMTAEELSNNEAKPLSNNVKSSQTINPLFDTLTAREIARDSGEENFIQDELSFEHVMQNLSADLANTQKNTVIQQAETISIMRKDFTDAVKDKVMVMINQKIQQIDIQLDPPELGSMQVRINMQNEQAVVSFVVQNQQAKEALEQNMDKLRHMMANTGVDVGEANVKQDSNQSAMQERSGHDANGSPGATEEGVTDDSINGEHTKVIKASSTGIDYYA